MKLALGTAQFGMSYGITNQKGCVERKEIEKILRIASDSGIDCLDTARVYGCSEAVLGEILGPSHSFKIITKTLPLNVSVIGQSELDQVCFSFETSLTYLYQTSLYGLLIHHGEELLLPGGERLFSKLYDFKQSGQIKKIGVSIYSMDLLEKIINMYPIDLVQFPANILDQRMAKANLIHKLERNDIEIYVRSAFLQGVLLKNIEQLPCYFSKNKQLRALQDFIYKSGIPRIVLALHYLKQSPMFDKILIGVVSDKELLECLNAYHAHFDDLVDYSQFGCDDVNFIDPSRWLVAS